MSEAMDQDSSQKQAYQVVNNQADVINISIDKKRAALEYEKQAQVHQP